MPGGRAYTYVSTDLALQLIQLHENSVLTFMMSAQDLSALLHRVARKDRAAFAEVYQATSAKLYGVALRILKRRDIADEVLQEVYVKVWERASDFDSERASPISWMSTIARNRALDEVRRKRPVAIEDHPEIQEFASDDEPRSRPSCAPKMDGA